MNLTNVRLSYPHLFTKSGMEGSTPKYSAQFILDPVVNAKEIKAIQDEIARMMETKLKVKKISNPNHCCLKNGDDLDKPREETNGKFLLTAKNADRPTLVDRSTTPVAEDDGVFYAGCYVNAKVDLYAYTKNAKGLLLILGESSS